MGELADRLDALVVSARSPDGRVEAVVGDRGTTVSVSFQPGVYRRYGETALAHQLEQMARLAWTRYARDVSETIDFYYARADGDFRTHGEGVTDTPERRRYLQELAEIVVEASSPEEHVSLRTHALASWKVTIAAGALGRLSEGQFLDELHAAVETLLARYRFRMLRIRDDIYGLGIPRHPAAEATTSTPTPATREVVRVGLQLRRSER
ncbi:MAG: YbaB/EbfC family nucleoid-associated protein [Micromonosporaceae bacterium]|nr:YbaB/EbfC family nucleoid-associated protein [Micromonosporaceae bacterium]